MTAKKDLKRRIRARQAETGESYVTARRHVVAGAPAPDASEPDPPPATATPPFVVEEMLHWTQEAEALGFACRVHCSSALAARATPEQILTRLRTILHGTTEDAAFEKLRRVCLRGEPVPAAARTGDWLERLRTFVQRAQVGLGGISPDGSMLAFTVDGKERSVMVLGHVGYRAVANVAQHRPRLVLSAALEEPFSMSTVFVR